MMTKSSREQGLSLLRDTWDTSYRSFYTRTDFQNLPFQLSQLSLHQQQQHLCSHSKLDVWPTNA